MVAEALGKSEKLVVDCVNEIFSDLILIEGLKIDQSVR